MNFRTILHYWLGRVITGLVALMVKINPPMIMNRSYYWTGENDEFKPHNHLIWNDTLYYQIGKEWISYTESIKDGMKIFEEIKE